jgi:anti-sigma factor RsiW
MNAHENLKDKIHAYYDGELTLVERTQVDAHLMECGDCRGALERWRRMAGAFLTAQAPLSSEAFVENVMARLENEPSGSWWTTPTWIFPLTGLAALLIMVAQGPQLVAAPTTESTLLTNDTISALMSDDEGAVPAVGLSVEEE